MPRGIKKENLPSKMCVSCERPFTWRKKWERCWDEVTTCSKSCNAKRRALAHPVTKPPPERSRITQGVEVVVTSEAPGMIPADGTPSGQATSVPATAPPAPRARKSGGGDDVTIVTSDASDDGDGGVTSEGDSEPASPRSLRKAAKKEAKAARRAARAGQGPVSSGNKTCDTCSREESMLIRCRTDASGEWRMVCGPCWKHASGGVTDGDAAHPFYVYGGVWKNKSKNQSDANLL